MSKGISRDALEPARIEPSGSTGESEKRPRRMVRSVRPELVIAWLPGVIVSGSATVDAGLTFRHSSSPAGGPVSVS